MMADAEQAKDELQNILSTHEYQVYYEDNRNFLQIWWDRFKEWLGDVLSKLFSSFEPSSGFANLVLFMVIAVVVVLVVLVVFLGIRKAGRSRKFRGSPPLKHIKEEDWTYIDHLKASRKKETDENYTGATRHLFLTLLLYFHEKEWLQARDWKTNWEYFAELRQINQQYAETFYHLAVTFDQVVYGKRVLQKNEYLLFRKSVMAWLHDGKNEQPSES